MARCNQQCFLSLKFSLQLLILVLPFAVSLTVAEKDVQIWLRGEVGGNVTFKSSTLKQGKIKYMYLQKESVYINGYHSERPNTGSEWPNTSVDNNTNEVHMFGLNMSHNGNYDLYIHYYNDPVPTRIIIQLNVTGKYTTPSVTQVCSDENNFKSCIVTCVSHGGFPSFNMTWNMLGAENTNNSRWKIVNGTPVQSKDTKLFTSSSTAYFNCSKGELKFNCSVDGVTSKEQSVCAQQDPPNNPNNHSLYMIVLACVVPFVVVIILTLWWWRYKKRPSGKAANVVKELQPNGHEEEMVVLTES